jgi:hypothetical protein
VIPWGLNIEARITKKEAESIFPIRLTDGEINGTLANSDSSWLSSVAALQKS